MRVTRGYHKTSFSRVASMVARLTGHPITFALACALIVVWLASGPLFGFSDTWQLVINTTTTIITFLMVFLIQNTQNRESMAVHVKLDELIRAVEGAHNAMLDLEELTEEELDKLRERYLELAQRAKGDLTRGVKDTGTAEISSTALNELCDADQEQGKPREREERPR
jgi:low affinity Fe/Cu permease